MAEIDPQKISEMENDIIDKHFSDENNSADDLKKFINEKEKEIISEEEMKKEKKKKKAEIIKDLISLNPKLEENYLKTKSKKDLEKMLAENFENGLNAINQIETISNLNISQSMMTNLFYQNLAVVNMIEVLSKNYGYDIEGATQEFAEQKEMLMPIYEEIYKKYTPQINLYVNPLFTLASLHFKVFSTSYINNKKKKSSQS